MIILIFVIMIFNMFYSIFLTSNLIIFSFLSLSFSDFIIIWFIMEVNNLLFISLLSAYIKEKKMIFMYFTIQAISSLMIIFMSTLNNTFFFSNSYFSLLLNFSLMLKLGLPPFHMWLPLISSSLTWNMLFLLFTIQKFTPFYMMSLLDKNMIIIYLITILASIIPPYMLLNNTNLKLIMAYSSINQSSWMIMLIFLNTSIWLTYFLFYSLILLILLTYINYLKLFMNSKYNLKNLPSNMILIILSLNLAGMPPFSLFFLKWYSIYIILLNTPYFLISIMMMMSSFIMLYIYINMMLYMSFILNLSSKFIVSSLNNSTFSNHKILLLTISLIMSQIIFMI